MDVTFTLRRLPNHAIRIAAFTETCRGRAGVYRDVDEREYWEAEPEIMRVLRRELEGYVRDIDCGGTIDAPDMVQSGSIPRL